ncbi:MAG: hypothetical protein WKF83_03095 [Nocardioidaceae bacterium]
MRHQPTHRRLEVVVADDPARYAGGTRADRRLVQDEDVLAGALAAQAQLASQVPRGGQAMHAGAHDDVPDAVGQRRAGDGVGLGLDHGHLSPLLYTGGHCRIGNAVADTNRR